MSFDSKTEKSDDQWIELGFNNQLSINNLDNLKCDLKDEDLSSKESVKDNGTTEKVDETTDKILEDKGVNLDEFNKLKNELEILKKELVMIKTTYVKSDGIILKLTNFSDFIKNKKSTFTSAFYYEKIPFCALFEMGQKIPRFSKDGQKVDCLNIFLYYGDTKRNYVCEAYFEMSVLNKNLQATFKRKSAKKLFTPQSNSFGLRFALPFIYQNLNANTASFKLDFKKLKARPIIEI